MKSKLLLFITLFEFLGEILRLLRRLKTGFAVEFLEDSTFARTFAPG